VKMRSTGERREIALATIAELFSFTRRTAAKDGSNFLSLLFAN